jgi:hypothetical protein
VTNEPTIHLQSSGDSPRSKVLFPEGDSEELLLRLIESDLYLLEESSLLGHACYHDVIRATPAVDGSLNFEHVVRRSGLSTTSWILPQKVIQSSELHAILSDVMRLGGNWEQAFGGLLLIHVPPQEADNIHRKIELLGGKH